MPNDAKIRNLEIEQRRRWDDHILEHAALNRRMADAENRLDKTDHILEAVVDIREYAKKTYEVFEPMAKVSAKVAKAGVFFTVIWHGVKWGMVGAKWALMKVGVIL